MLPNPTHLPPPSPLSPKQMNKQNKGKPTKQNKQQQKKNLVEAVVWPVELRSSPKALSSSSVLARSHWVWLKVIDNRLSLDLPLDILLSCVMGILQFWMHKFVPFTCSNSS